VKLTRLPEPAVAARDLAQVWDVKPQTIRRWIERGELEAVKLGRDWRVTIESANRFFEARRVRT